MGEDAGYMSTYVEGGFIFLYRKLRHWEWYKDTNCVRVFIELLLTAAYEEKRYKGMVIKRGQVWTSLNMLSSITNLTPKQIRVVLKKFQEGRLITSERAGDGQLITLVDWEKFQDSKSNRADVGRTKGQDKGTPIDKETKNKKINKKKISFEELEKEVIKLVEMRRNGERITFKQTQLEKIYNNLTNKQKEVGVMIEI